MTSIGALAFFTMSPDLRPATPVYIDQESTGRDGTDSVLDAWRSGVQTITTTIVTTNYANALIERDTQRLLQLPGSNIVTIVDDSGTSFTNCHIRKCNPVAWAQADGSGIVITEWEIRVTSAAPVVPGP